MCFIQFHNTSTSTQGCTKHPVNPKRAVRITFD